MLTLYLSAPYDKTQQMGAYYKDFYTILNSAVGPDYAIHSGLLAQIQSGMPVVVFDRVRQLQARGIVDHVAPRPYSRVPRYHVYIRNLAPVRYNRPPRVNRCGVEVG